MEIKLTGWKALAVVAAVVGVLAYRYATLSATLEEQGVDAIKDWLVVDTARRAISQLEDAMGDLERREQRIEAIAEKLDAERFEILSVTRQGLGDTIVARVEVRSERDDASAEPEVRYLSMRHASVTGWTVVRETSAWHYHLAIF